MLISGIEKARRPTGPALAMPIALICLFLGQGLGILVFGLLFQAAPGELFGGQLTLPAQLALTMSSLGSVLLLAAWLRWKEQRRFATLGFSRNRAGFFLVVGTVVALVAMAVPVLLNVLFGQSAIVDVSHAQLAAVLLALAGFAVQGSTEEILMRGYVLQTTSRAWGLPAAIVLQAIMFTGLHGQNAGLNAVAVLNLGLVAVTLAFWALAEGGLWGVCAFHAVWNWCQGNVYGIEVSGLNVSTSWLDVDNLGGSADLLTGGPFGVEGSLLTTAVLTAVLAFAVAAYRRTRA